VGPGRSTVAFKATKPGLFPVIVTPSTFDIATVRVSRR
jgi:hypothetical protein